MHTTTNILIGEIFLCSILEDKQFENKACCLVYDFMRGSLNRIKPGKSAEVALDQSDSYKVARGDIVSVRVIREKSFEVIFLFGICLKHSLSGQIFITKIFFIIN